MEDILKSAINLYPAKSSLGIRFYYDRFVGKGMVDYWR